MYQIFMLFFKIGLHYFKSNSRVQACSPLFIRGYGFAVFATVQVPELLFHYPIVWTMKSSVVGTRVLAVQ